MIRFRLPLHSGSTSFDDTAINNVSVKAIKKKKKDEYAKRQRERRRNLEATTERREAAGGRVERITPVSGRHFPS